MTPLGDWAVQGSDHALRSRVEVWTRVERVVRRTGHPGDAEKVRARIEAVQAELNVRASTTNTTTTGGQV